MSDKIRASNYDANGYYFFNPALIYLFVWGFVELSLIALLLITVLPVSLKQHAVI